MIGWTTAIFVQTQRIWSSDSDLVKTYNVNLALKQLTVHPTCKTTLMVNMVFVMVNERRLEGKTIKLK